MDTVDLVVARGGKEFIRTVVEHSRIPVIKHDKGLCHTYIDSEADLTMAANVAFNAKVQRPSVCNAMETLLVHRDVARRFLPAFCDHLKAAGVEVRGCSQTLGIVPWAVAATDEDWDTEYLDLILSIKLVDSLDDALEHIARHSSKLRRALSPRIIRKLDAFSIRSMRLPCLSMPQLASLMVMSLALARSSGLAPRSSMHAAPSGRVSLT